jgi:hypothetical protein
MEIEMARLLCLKAAWMMDQGDARAAAPWISQIKVVAPRVALKVTDEAVQMFGGQGISQDTPLARMWTHLRTLGSLTVPIPCTAARSPAPNSSATPRKRSDPAMKAIICPDYGPLSNLEYRDLPIRKPAPMKWCSGRGDRRQLSRRAAGAGALSDEARNAVHVPGMEAAASSKALAPMSPTSSPATASWPCSINGAYAEKVLAPAKPRVSPARQHDLHRRLRADVRLGHLASRAQASGQT